MVDKGVVDSLMAEQQQWQKMKYVPGPVGSLRDQAAAAGLELKVSECDELVFEGKAEGPSHPLDGARRPGPGSSRSICATSFCSKSTRQSEWSMTRKESSYSLDERT